jgi:hypothetical protein
MNRQRVKYDAFLAHMIFDIRPELCTDVFVAFLVIRAVSENA